MKPLKKIDKSIDLAKKNIDKKFSQIIGTDKKREDVDKKLEKSPDQEKKKREEIKKEAVGKKTSHKKVRAKATHKASRKEDSAVKPEEQKTEKLFLESQMNNVMEDVKKTEVMSSEEGRTEDIGQQGMPSEERIEVAKDPTSTQENDLKDNVHDHKNQVEAILFASGKYCTEDEISSLSGIDKRHVKKALEELRSEYEKKNSSLAIFQEDKSWKINVREKYLSLVRKIVSDTELARSTMETLAVIAWKSPVYQSEVVKIRGNKCYDHIDDLETSGFISKDKKGRSFVLKTTDKFYNYFEVDHGNMKSLMDSVNVPVINAEDVAKQTTLDEVGAPQGLVNPNAENKIDAINVLKRTETDEEKSAHKDFLESMDKKISEAKERNTALENEIPRPTLQMQNPSTIQQTQQDSETAKPASPDPGDIIPKVAGQAEPVQDTPAGNPALQIQNPAVQKPRSLTKKQLEKKFKDELLRVKEKMDKK